MNHSTDRFYLPAPTCLRRYLEKKGEMKLSAADVKGGIFDVTTGAPMAIKDTAVVGKEMGSPSPAGKK